MQNSAMRRARRFVGSFAEPSGWRSLKFEMGSDRRQGQVEVPRAALVKKISPDHPGKFDHIPSIIFQTWKSRSEIPENYRYWRQTFVKNNPDAQVILWDDDDNREFITREFPWFLPVYNSFPKEIFRADAVRYLFLFSFGGLYADMDSECLRPLRLESRSEEVVLAQMGRDLGFEHSIPNALMASRPGQAFWLLVVQRMLEAADKYDSAELKSAAGPEELTGPILLKYSFDEFRSLDQDALRARIEPVMRRLNERQRASVRIGQVTLLDRNAWYPLDWTNVLHKRLRNSLDRDERLLSPEAARWIFPQAELVTYWSHSW